MTLETESASYGYLFTPSLVFVGGKNNSKRPYFSTLGRSQRTKLLPIEDTLRIACEYFLRQETQRL
jgi:hypothetical protein